MPNTKSAARAQRSSQRKRAYNLRTINKYKTAVRAVRKALLAKKREDTQKFLVEAYSQLDKAAKKHVIHRGRAGRLKSRLAKALAKI